MRNAPSSRVAATFVGALLVLAASPAAADPAAILSYPARAAESGPITDLATPAGAAGITVRPLADQPDIRVASFYRLSATANEGDPYWVQPVFINQGTAAAGASHARAYLSPAYDVNLSDDYPLGEKAVAAMAVGATTSVVWTFNVPDMGSGTYDVYLVIVCDSQNEVAESNEYNNLTVSAVPAYTASDGGGGGGLPDLQVPQYQASSHSPTEGDSMWLNAQVWNAGAGAAGASVTRLYISTDNDLDVSDDYFIGDKNTLAIPAGDTTVVQWSFLMPNLGTGPYSAWFVFEVDATGSVTESNEANNVRISTTTMTVSEGSGGGTPDLEVTSLQVQGATAAEGGAFWVKELIHNGGTGSAAPSHARLYLSTDNDLDTSDDYYVGEYAVPALGAGSQTWALFDFIMPDLGSGTYTVWTVCVVDAQGEVAESNEANTFKSSNGAFAGQDAGAAPQAAFTVSPASPQAGQTVTFTDTSTGSPASWAWNFGDSWTSTAQNPSHAYAAAGTYTVSLTVSNAQGSSSTSKTVTVGSGGTGGYQYWLSVGSHWQGAGTSAWRTDVGLLNTTGSTANVTVVLHVGSSSTSDTATVAPHSQSILVDIVAQLGYAGSGSLEIQSDQPLRVTSRTYTAEAFGTLGQAYGPYTTADGLANGESAWLPQLTENATYRTNIGLTNTGSASAQVRVDLYNGAGTLLTSYTVNLAAGEWKQEYRPFNGKAGQTSMDRGYAKVTVLSGSGIIAYASVADNSSNDPTTIVMQR